MPSNIPATTIRIDPEVKREATAILDELGLSMSTAVTMLAKKMAREKRLPFEVALDPFYSPENQARLRRSIAQMEATDSH